ncbi:alpha/beta fold hydrolase [Bradyrhizobium lablabi]|uniref:alpha/beta fold hydrolase n=1 Tax=Bradyrhizobium lablabi TaxID=722472 RepID=UPI0032DFF14C
MTDNTDVERRILLRAIGAVSGTALSSALLAQQVGAQPAGKATSAASDHFETREIKVDDNTIFIRRYGNGSPLLMVHGFPRTSLMWRHMAPQFANDHTVICVDLRGYGRSGVVASAEDHYPYSKRAMANELVAVMDRLGFPRFDLVGHDRGGRVSYRLALDHPERVRRLAVFDVIPISEGWGHADAKFAMTYWPWILLSQKTPLPEKYLLGAPGAVFDNPFGEGSFGPEVRTEYTENVSRSRPGTRDLRGVPRGGERGYRARQERSGSIPAYWLPDAPSLVCRRTTRYLLRTVRRCIGNLAELG